MDSFDELEDRLRRRLVPELPVALRSRVLAEAIIRPLASRWQFAAGLAAALLIGLNLAVAAANDQVAGPFALRWTPPPGAALASAEGSATPLRLGCPWLPCDLPGSK